MQTILIIDDEQSIRESLTGILQDEGFTPLSAENGEQAIEMLEGDLPRRRAPVIVTPEHSDRLVPGGL